MPNAQGKSDLNPRGSKAGIPVRYRCKVGGEWKHIQAFSANQQRLIQRQVNGRGRVDTANSGMTCLEHSAAFRGELRCDLCGRIRPYDDFSKTMRKSDEPMCKQCTAWTETQEPGVTPAPLPTGHVSAEEQSREPRDYKMPEDFFPSDALPQAPITELSSLYIDATKVDSAKSSAASSTGRGPSSNVSGLPPHLKGILHKFAATGDDDKSLQSSFREDTGSLGSEDTSGRLGSDVQSRGNAGSQKPASKTRGLPPHLRQQLQDLKPSKTPFVGGFQGPTSFNGDTASISTATTMREQNEEVVFNAWDNSGKLHERSKALTNQSNSSASSNSVADGLNAIGGWGDAPAEKDMSATRRKGGKSGWHKAPVLAPQQLAPKEMSARHVDMEVDRQRRMNYCNYDDSDD